MTSKHFDIAPLPTTYHGTAFRSRVEATWSLLFDAAGIRHSYEPDGYRLRSGGYAPDFLLHDLRVFFEVKGAVPTDEERQKCAELAELTNTAVLLAIGKPQSMFQIMLFRPEGEDPGIWVLTHDRYRDGGFWLLSTDDDYWLGPYSNLGVEKGGPCFDAMDRCYDAAREERWPLGRRLKRHPMIPFPEDAGVSITAEPAHAA